LYKASHNTSCMAVHRRRRHGGRRRLRGRGKVGDWFKNTFRKIGDFFTGSHIISSAAPIIGALTGNPALGMAAGTLAGAVGLGHRRRRRHRRRHLHPNASAPQAGGRRRRHRSQHGGWFWTTPQVNNWPYPTSAARPLGLTV
jgi:hypothetical protein